MRQVSDSQISTPLYLDILIFFTLLGSGIRCLNFDSNASISMDRSAIRPVPASILSSIPVSSSSDNTAVSHLFSVFFMGL